MDGLTFANPDDATKFVPGMTMVIVTYPPWWKRLLYWLRILRKPKPITFTVEKVDYENGIIGIET